MFGRAVMVTAVLAGTMLGMPRAHAVPAGVDSCDAGTDGTAQSECTFVASGGLYTLRISTDGSYSWVSVGCQYGNSWTHAMYGGGTGSGTFSMGGGLCTLRVGSNGRAYASVAKA